MTLQPNQTAAPDATPHLVLAAVRDETNLRPLLRLARAIARAHGGGVRLLTVTRSGDPPPWLKLEPAEDDANVDVDVRVVTRSGRSVGPSSCKRSNKLRPTP